MKLQSKQTGKIQVSNWYDPCWCTGCTGCAGCSGKCSGGCKSSGNGYD